MFIKLSDYGDKIKLRAAEILHDATRSITITSWNTIDSALNEVNNLCKPGFIVVGLIQKKILVGWAGLQPMYGDITWELHPLVVDPEYQKKGIGTKILKEIEKIAIGRNIHNIMLGTDDELGKTSLAKIDLYKADIFTEINNIKNINNHPFTFYQKNGYKIIGVVPDASGKFKHDIIMGKRIKCFS